MIADANEICLSDIPYVDGTRERIDISYDSNSFDFTVERHRVAVRNARAADPPPSLEREGFSLEYWPSEVVATRREELIEANSRPREDMAPVTAAYLGELAPLIARVSGAREVFAQYDTITVRFSSRSARQSWMGTAAFAHFDFEASSADRLLAETLALTGRLIAPFRRQVLYQTWRVLTPPPQDTPLALCDGRTIRACDVVPMDFHGPKGTRNELVRSRAGQYSSDHRWFYYRDMTPDEVLVFKGFDSDAPEGRTAMHTAFDDVSVLNPVPRGSIECRFIALYD